MQAETNKGKGKDKKVAVQAFDEVNENRLKDGAALPFPLSLPPSPSHLLCVHVLWYRSVFVLVFEHCVLHLLFTRHALRTASLPTLPCGLRAKSLAQR